MATSSQIRAQLTRSIELVTSRIGVGLINNLRSVTPRDTSWHASRWVGAAGGEPSSVNTPNTRAGRAAALSFSQQASSLAQLGAYRLGQGNIFVTNDGDYIEQLDQRENFIAAAVRRSVNISIAGSGLRR